MGNEGSRLECRGVEWGMREAGWKHECSHKSEVAITFICTNQETVSVGKDTSKQNI